MHILMFLASTGRGGAESLVANLSNQLVKKHRITVLVFDGTEWADQLDAGVKQVSLGRKKSRRNPLLYYNIQKSIKRIRPDLVHVHGAKATNIFSKLENRLSIPVIATKHNSRKGRVYDEMQHVIAVSGEVASTVNHEVTVIYNGIDASETVTPDLQAGKFRLLSVGRLDRVKGFDLLVAAMQAMPDEVVLQIAGEGEEHEALQKQIEKLGLEKRVSLLGFRDDIRTLMSQAHAVIIASHTEGFSLVLVESFFYGNLLLSTNVGGAAEVLCEPLLLEHHQLAGKIESVMKNYQHYQKLFTECRQQHAEKFTVENMAAGHEKYYLKVLEQYSPTKGR